MRDSINEHNNKSNKINLEKINKFIGQKFVLLLQYIQIIQIIYNYTVYTIIQII